jgi:hypothetical protein
MKTILPGKHDLVASCGGGLRSCPRTRRRPPAPMPPAYTPTRDRHPRKQRPSLLPARKPGVMTRWPSEPQPLRSPVHLLTPPRSSTGTSSAGHGRRRPGHGSALRSDRLNGHCNASPGGSGPRDSVSEAGSNPHLADRVGPTATRGQQPARGRRTMQQLGLTAHRFFRERGQ